ncbi:MAG: alpha/beta hydrolase [Pirellulales bacterium]
MPTFVHDGLNFHYRECGSGLPFVFQHGLGADLQQSFELFTPPRGCRLIAFDCRAHGGTAPIGPDEKVSLDYFATDLVAFLDHLQLDAAVIGGTSMGAAMTLKFAVRTPHRVLGLVQSRPAWLTGPNQQNATKFAFVARLLRELGAARGKQEFLRSEFYGRVKEESLAAANSLSSQFDSPHAEERAIRLERIPLGAAIVSLEELIAIRVPALVLAHRHDPIHPYEYGEALAEAVPRAEFREITAKSICAPTHAVEVQRHLSEFLQQNFL